MKIIVPGRGYPLSFSGHLAGPVHLACQVAFHGPSACARGQEVLYVTERAVFRLGGHGLELIETATGTNVENEICAQMKFRPNIADPKAMPAKCFRKD